MALQAPYVLSKHPNTPMVVNGRATSSVFLSLLQRYVGAVAGSGIT